MNEALPQVDPRAAADAGAAGPWNAWNHLRTAACGAAFLCSLAAPWRWPG